MCNLFLFYLFHVILRAPVSDVLWGQHFLSGLDLEAIPLTDTSANCRLISPIAENSLLQPLFTVTLQRVSSTQQIITLQRICSPQQ